MSGIILVLIKHLDEIAPGRALVAALPERSFSLSFANEDLRTRFGESPHATTTDPFSHLLAPEPPGLVLCFAGARELGPSSNLLQLSYFDELGIPTVELQRDVLRDPTQAASESAARHYLPWSGPRGIGCLRLPPDAAQSAARDDLVLVCSQLTREPYSEEERFRFAFSVIRLAREHPHLTFLWRASAAEEQSAEAKLVLSMLGTTAPTNLWLEENEPLEKLTARASAVVCMAQTVVLDFVAARKPTLIYTSDRLLPLSSELSFTRFSRPDELLEAWTALRSEPARFVPASRIPDLSAARLRSALSEIEAGRSLRPDRRELTMRYLAYLQDARARADLGRLAPQLMAMEKRMGEFEKVLAQLRDKLAKEATKPPRDTGRFKVARKALKLVAQVRKRGFGSL